MSQLGQADVTVPFRSIFLACHDSHHERTTIPGPFRGVGDDSFEAGSDCKDRSSDENTNDDRIVSHRNKTTYGGSRWSMAKAARRQQRSATGGARRAAASTTGGTRSECWTVPPATAGTVHPSHVCFHAGQKFGMGGDNLVDTTLEGLQEQSTLHITSERGSSKWTTMSR